MCTVTFIPTSKGIYLTSNRDENKQRLEALPPAQHDRLIYPKDLQASGSWIGMKENGDAAVLLNGAFVKHERQPAYRKSRGLVFLDIFERDNPRESFSAIDLENIEPFTLVLYCNKQLWEYRWDGHSKHALLLDASKPHIWSSATLYDDETRQQRKRWFLEWFSSTSPIDISKVMGFHERAGQGDLYNGLVINRDKIRTVSITAVSWIKGKPVMNYYDLQTGVKVATTFGPPAPRPRGSIFLFARKVKIRLTNWEYWPIHFVYGPLYVYWCWLSIKARSFFFFSAANPGIQYAGFVQERKSEIYKLIPRQYYPLTRLCTAEELVAEQELEKEGLLFPLIAKPDVGERGMQVKLLHSRAELDTYASRSKVNFLLQEFISYQQEVGIFYYRIPGEEKGHISGIVAKEFLTVTGDGVSSIRSLLEREDRFLLQLQALEYTYGDFLNTVLADGAAYVLVPYGSHSRGAKFLDLSHMITEALSLSIDNVCRQIPGFYYGRLDVKFNSWKELSEGKNFSIIELNGAGSEPTHIYDPGHSLWYAWKEICRHWSLLYRISRLNARRKKLVLMSTGDGIRMIRTHARYLKNIAQV
jgi:hypothetical protein